MSKEQLVSEVAHCDEEIKWLNDYERQLKAKASESLNRKDFSNYLSYLQQNYSLEISSDDDYRSSSVKEFDVVRRSIRSTKGNKMKFSRSKHLNYGSRHRKARPKRKKNNKLCEPCYPFYLEKTQMNYDVEPFGEYSYVKKRRPKVAAVATYPTSRLIRRHSSRLISPKLSNRLMKKNLTRDCPSNVDIKIIQEWPDQRVSRTRDNNRYHSEIQRTLQNDSLKESLRKRSTDSIYINPRFDPNLNQEEAATLNSKKEFEVRRCYVDKTNENSFQKRLSGGSNFSGSTNNQYCPRLDGPCSCEEETNKSKNCNLEKGRSLSSSSKRKEEWNIYEKNCDWHFKDFSKSKSRYPSSRSFTSISSARSTKGVIFDKNAPGIPLISGRTPCQLSRSSRKNDKSSFIEKKVHYEPKCVRTNDLIKDKDDLCCFCKNEQFDNMRNRKLCNLVHSKEGKILMKCCCSENEQEDNRKCNEHCCCPENPKLLQTLPKRDISTTYEKFRKDKDFLHSTSLPGNNFRINSTNKLVESISKNKNELSPKKSFLDHCNKCNERLKEVSKDYQKLSSNLKTMRDICCHPDKTRRKTNEHYSREKDSSFAAAKISPKRRTTDLRSPVRPNEIDEIDEYCYCKELFRQTLPSTCPYDRNERSFNESETRHDTRSRKKLEKDSMKKLENFCDRVKATNRNIDKKLKENLERRNTLNVNRIYQECHCDSESSVQELWKPVKKSTMRRKELPGNSVDLRIVKPKYSYGKTSLDKILIYPPDVAAGPPLTLFKNSSNISCQVKGDEDRGYRYNVIYVQKFISPAWRPEIECPGNRIRQRGNECDCSSDYG